MPEQISLEARQRDYQQAEDALVLGAARWLEARAAGRVSQAADARLDEHTRELYRAKRRLEQTERRCRA